MIPFVEILPSCKQFNGGKEVNPKTGKITLKGWLYCLIKILKGAFEYQTNNGDYLCRKYVIVPIA